jgi:hypothetical protein
MDHNCKVSAPATTKNVMGRAPAQGQTGHTPGSAIAGFGGGAKSHASTLSHGAYAAKATPGGAVVGFTSGGLMPGKV